MPASLYWVDSSLWWSSGDGRPPVRLTSDDIGAEVAALESAARVERNARYPHDCPRCGGWAYVGANEVDCYRKCEP